MFATPQDFIDKYKEFEFAELFAFDDLCQETLDEAWGQMQIYLHRYVPFEPLHSPLLPYELTLKGYQLTICRYLASEHTAPREQVCEAYKVVLMQLKLIAEEKIQLPIYDPVVETVAPLAPIAKVVPRAPQSGSMTSVARRCW